MLLRSEPAQLDMKIDYWRKLNLNLINNLGMHCRRCHTLRVQHFALSTILPQFNGSTTLQVFQLSATNPQAGEVVPRDLIQSLLRCPILTHLEINCCVLPLEELPVLPTLKTLQLYFLGKQSPGSIEALRKALSSMPALETLGMILDAIKSRSTAHRLAKVTFKNTNFGVDILERLRDVVGVDWE